MIEKGLEGRGLLQKQRINISFVTSKRAQQKNSTTYEEGNQHDKVRTHISDNCEKMFEKGWSEGLCICKKKLKTLWNKCLIYAVVKARGGYTEERKV